jgi:hypothetical protein
MTGNFVYHDGRFLPFDLEKEKGLVWGEREDLTVALGKIKFTQTSKCGDPDSVHYQLFGRSLDTGGVDWVVIFNTACTNTAYTFCTIYCDSWPGLIGLLGTLSPIVLAARQANCS